MFAIPDLVGGTDGIMIGNLIKSQFLDSRDWPFGSALSIALTGCILLLVALGMPRAPAREAPMRRPYLLWSATALVYLFLYVPLVIVVLYSFNDSRLNAEWVGFTLTGTASCSATATCSRPPPTRWSSRWFRPAWRPCSAPSPGSPCIASLRVLPLLVLTPIAIPELLMGSRW